MKKWRGRAGLTVAALALLASMVLVLNAFDEPLDAKAAALGEPRPAAAPEAANAYLAVIGMGAGDGIDSMTYAAAWLTEARTAARENRPEKRLEGTRAARPLLCDAAQTSCLAVVQDNPQGARAQLAAYHEDLARYEKLLAKNIYEEILDYRINPDAQFPRYASMGAAQRAWLMQAALAAQAGDVGVALETVERDMAFARVMLSGSRTLVGRMVAAANYTRDLAFVTDLLQTSLADLKPHAPRLQAMLRPLDLAALNMDTLMEAEFGVIKQLLKDPLAVSTTTQPPLHEKAFMHLFYKPNATVNGILAFYTQKQQWLRQPPSTLARARDTADIARSELKPWDYIYNPAGKILMRVAVPSFTVYALHLHDLGAINRLLALGAEIIAADVPAEDIAGFIAKAGAQFADPYTGKPMAWDAAGRQLSTTISDAYAGASGNAAASEVRKRFNIENGRAFLRM